MTVSELIRRHEEAVPTSHFFDKKTLRFFGERKSDMRVFKDTWKVKDFSGNEHECYVLSTLQRTAPAGPRRSYHYFDIHTMKEVMRNE